MPNMSTIQYHSHYVAVIKRCTLNLMSCVTIPRTCTFSCALKCIAHGIPSYNHNASVRSTTLLPLREWPRLERLPLSQYLGPSQVRRICQQWIGIYPHIPAVALVAVRLGVIPRQPPLVICFPPDYNISWQTVVSWQQWLCLGHLFCRLPYVIKTKRCIISIVLSLI